MMNVRFRPTYSLFLVIIILVNITILLPYLLSPSLAPSATPTTPTTTCVQTYKDERQDPQLAHPRPSSRKVFSNKECLAIAKNEINEMAVSYGELIPQEDTRRIFLNAYEMNINKYVQILEDDSVYVITGDIGYMWLRDSVAQMWAYLPLANQSNCVSQILRGLLDKHITMILMDSWTCTYKPYPVFLDEKRSNSRGGYVGSRNYELDSNCWTFRLAYYYWKTTNDVTIFDRPFIIALEKVVVQWKLEQRHKWSTYFFGELPNGGRGEPVEYTGMTWSAYRPSDDFNQFGYNIPANLFVVVTLKQTIEILTTVYERSAQDRLVQTMVELKKEIEDGIRKHGLISFPYKIPPPMVPDDDASVQSRALLEVEQMRGESDVVPSQHVQSQSATTSTLVLAYEVDGLGGHTITTSSAGRSHMIDDANVPSLLSIPYLDRDHSFQHEYNETRRFLLSSQNLFYFQGSAISGIGSKHTPASMVWPMAVITEAFTTDNRTEKLRLINTLVQSAYGGLLHESVHVNNYATFTREEFVWVNAYFAELVIECIGEGLFDHET